MFKISTSFGQKAARRINAHRKSHELVRWLVRNSSEGASGIIRRSALLFLPEEEEERARTVVFFSLAESSPGMVIRHATSSTRDALIPVFFWRPGINL